MLVEFYNSVAAESTSKALEMVVASGMVPVIAHVERYDAANPETVRGWRDIGAKMQVDAGEYLKDSTRGRRARVLTSLGLVDLTASDNHGDSRTVEYAERYFEDSGFPDVGVKMCETNPRALLEDRELEDVLPVGLKEGWWSRVKGALGA